MAQATKDTGSGIIVSAARRKAASKGFFRTSAERFLRDKLSLVCAVIFILIAIVSYSADFISQNITGWSRDKDDATAAILADKDYPTVRPGVAGHVLGTDDNARDVLTRLIYGGQVSISVGLLTMLISVAIGTTLGLMAGFFGGWVDDVINALVQIISNIPALFLLIILSLIWKPDVLSLSVIIGVISWTGTTRQVRGSVLSLRSRDYVDAARVMGASNSRILGVHIFPNVASIMLVIAGFDVVGAMTGEAGLSFLGFGIGVPVPSWGNMLANSQEHFVARPWLVYAPALALFVTVLCVYLLADGLRDAFDPRLKDK